MRQALITLTLLLVCAAPTAGAQSFDPSQCSRIQDVDVPYEVSTSEGAFTFSHRGAQVMVSPQSISADGRTHASPNVAQYHQRLARFLDQAAITARAVNPLAGNRAGFGEAVTNMCEAILNLAESNRLIEGEFNGYSSPVRIQLR